MHTWLGMCDYKIITICVTSNPAIDIRAFIIEFNTSSEKMRWYWLPSQPLILLTANRIEDYIAFSSFNGIYILKNGKVIKKVSLLLIYDILYKDGILYPGTVNGVYIYGSKSTSTTEEVGVTNITTSTGTQSTTNSSTTEVPLPALLPMLYYIARSISKRYSFPSGSSKRRE